MIDEFQVEYEVDRGGMGVVYRCYDTANNRPVALKILTPYKLESDKSRKRFDREIAIIAQLEHPNIAELYAIGEWEGRPYIAMEWIEGATLQSIIHEKGVLSFDEAKLLFDQISSGLTYAHQKDIVHRDLKPSNIMVRSDQSIAIIDFGLAQQEQAVSVTGENIIVGTPLYMSPEQIQGKKVDQRADIYSLGTILYEMLVGTPPFGAVANQAVFHHHLYGAPPPLTEQNPTISIAVEATVLKALEKSPEERFGSVTEFYDALIDPESFADAQAILTPPLSRNRWYWIGLGIFLLLLLTIGTLQFVRPDFRQNILGPPQPALVIYDDDFPKNWANWSWGIEHSHQETSPVYDGTYALSVKYTQGFAGLYAHTEPPIDLTNFNSLRFWAHGGQEGGQSVMVVLIEDGGRSETDWQLPGYEFTLTKDKWTLIDIPLSELGHPSFIEGIVWQDGFGDAQPFYYLDQIELVP